MRLRLAAAAPLVGALLVGALLLGAPAPAWAQEPDELTQRSLPLRTALHHDPTLESALERLLALYREADRVEELVGVYRSHLSSYPRDLSARTVFVRLLLLSGDREAENELRRAVALFPQQGYLAYLRYQLLEQDNDPRALDLLDKAISLERRPVRRRAWVQRLLERAVSSDRRDLARKHLKDYAKLLGSTAGAHLAAARKMLAYDFHLETLEELEQATKKRPNPETGVEIELLAAKALVALKRREEAAKRLDELLGKLTADYWRRPEILRRRARLISSAKERESLVKQARADWEREQTPAKALDLARLLSGFDRRREALDVIVAASRKLPQVRRLEQEALALFDRLRDERGRIAYLEERLEREPERLDLAEQRMRSLFQLGRNAAAQKALDEVVAKLAPRDQVKRLAETARFLRAQAFPSFAAQVFRKAVDAAPRRLDLRRELAETLLATGEVGAAHAALRQPLPPKVDTALFLDLVQLMLRERLLRPARGALLQQLQARPEHFELLLALLEVEGRLGNGRRGRELAERTRKLADNQARYRRWLEAALGFYEFFFREELFFKGEQERFVTDEAWTKRRQERLLAFADLCAAQQRAEALSKLIAQLLERKDLPKNLELELRRRLVAVPTFETEEVKRTVANLEQLAKEDPARKTEYSARLALAHAAAQRLDKARAALAEVDASNLRDPDLLRGLAGLARHLRDGERSLGLLERVTEVDPGDREAWERYIYALATTGDEARLRGALHQILRAGPKLPLDAKVRRLLRAHLSDSAWRSVAAHLAEREDDDALEALALLDQVERTSDEGRTWVWVAWARAYAHNQLGQTKERDAALAELERAFDNLERTQQEAAEQAKRERERKLAEAKRVAAANGGPP
ncbi:MAG TPA: hypothetical protein DEA08_16885, partial [Planctomycetes bacterium]|nr:hypothetical protein [Planctomycetota bacterium]